MKIVFHGANAATFRPDFETYLDGSHSITVLSDDLSEAVEELEFADGEVIIGTALSNHHPIPKNARLYQVAGAGYDGVDLTRIPKECYLCNCFGHEVAITEYVMAALLTKFVPLVDADTKLRRGNWEYMAGKPDGLRRECSKSSIGILGYGHIGKAVAKRAKAFDMEVHVANRSDLLPDKNVDVYYPLAEIDRFYRAAEVIVVSLPLTEDTTGLVNNKAFTAMRPDCLLINVGRGAVIDEEALFTALQQKKIGGAVIDTWYIYPHGKNDPTYPGNLPFHTLDNIIITPHMSGWTWGTIHRRQEVMAENIRRLAAEDTLLNVIVKGK